MKLRLYICSLFITLMSASAAIGQCEFSQSVIIADQATSTIDITVAGLIINDLADPDQGLCSIKIHFTHDFVGDITMDLISPSGQSVNLVGPAVNNSPYTGNVYGWNIDIVRCSDIAMPDFPFLTDEFNTLDPWGNLVTYSGSFYPHSGCLEDFNMGPANGDWTLEVSDVSQFGAGEITFIELIFCENTNVQCFNCEADGGMLTTVLSNYCEGDPDLNLDVEPVYTGMTPSTFHQYGYIITQNNIVLDIAAEPDLTSYSFGEYEICGLSYLEIQEPEILLATIGEFYSDLTLNYTNADLCADLSDNCVLIHIVEVPDTIINEINICAGESFTVNGISYDETGVYVTSINQANCDTIALLDLTVIENQAEISSDQEFISCNLPSAILSSEFSIYESGAILEWFTSNGMIPSGTENNTNITITDPGIYGLSIVNQNCADTAYIDIQNDGSIPSFSFNLDTLTCDDPFTIIDMEPSIPLLSQMWTGPVTASNEDILVAVAGVYYIAGIADNGCIGYDSVIVVDNIEVFMPLFNSESFNCIEDTIQIMTTLPDSLSFLYSWSGANIVLGDENVMNPRVLQNGLYTLELTSLDNGCIETFSYVVPIDTIRPPLTIMSDTLTCTFELATLIASSADTNASYRWFFDNQFVDEGDTIEISNGGTYTVIATYNNGCLRVEDFDVVQDTLIPLVDVNNAILTCNTDSVQILTSTLETDLSYSWQGPFGFTSTSPSPYVENPGAYNLAVINAAGCSTNFTAFVGIGQGIANLSFSYDILDCNILETTIVPSDTTNLIFDWVDNSVADTSEVNYTVDAPGFYPLMVTDTTTGCIAFYELQVLGDYDPPIITYTLDTLDCELVSFSPMVDSEPLDSISWFNNLSYQNNDLVPTFIQGGEYFLYAEGLNGCVYLDTFNVVQDTIRPIINVITPLLDCGSPTVTVVVNSDLEANQTWINSSLNIVTNNDSLIVNSPGDFTAYVEAINHCVDSVDFTIMQDLTPPEVLPAAFDNLTCLDPISSVSLTTLENGLSYVWSGPSVVGASNAQMVDVDEPGMYTVVVTDTASCETVVNFDVVSEIEYPIIDLSSTVIDCADSESTISLTVPNDVSSIVWDAPFAINEGETNIITDQIGTYIVSVTAVNNCVTIGTTTVVIDTIVPIINLSLDGILDCNTDIVTLESVSSLANSQFTWTTPEGAQLDGNTIMVTQPGMYELTVVAPNSCEANGMIEVEKDTLRPTIALGEDPVFNCIEGKVLLSINTDPNVVSYLWNGPTGMLTDPSPFVFLPGIYTVTVTNDLGCTSSATINVIDDTMGPDITVRDTFITCDLNAVPIPIIIEDTEVTYLWEGPNFTSDLESPLVDQLGQYIVYAQLDRNQCITIDTMYLSFKEVPPIFNALSEDIDCYNNGANLKAIDVIDDQSAIWTNDAFDPLENDSLTTDLAGIYYLIVTGQNECEDTVMITVEDLRAYPAIAIELNEPFQCENMAVTLNGIVTPPDPIASLTWTSNNGMIIAGENSKDAMIEGEGTYVLSALYNYNGCESVDSITLVEEPQSLLGAELDATDPNCLDYADGTIMVICVDGGFSPYTYYINEDIASSLGEFDSLEAGNYNITVVDSIGCEVVIPSVLNEGFLFKALAERDTLIIVGEHVVLNSVFNVPDSEISYIDWKANTYDFECDDCFNPDVNPLFNTIYTLTATTVNGCIDSSFVSVRVNRNPKVSIANVITPDRDFNNEFFVQQTIGIESVESFSVFDRWGSRVFHIEDFPPGDPTYAWDGRFNGSAVNPGVYVVIINMRLYSGEVITYKGDVTVLK